jgi:hypothetical protein
MCRNNTEDGDRQNLREVGGDYTRVIMGGAKLNFLQNWAFAGNRFPSEAQNLREVSGDRIRLS